MTDFALMVPALKMIAKESHYLWDIPKNANYQLINLSENATFKITTQNNQFILRINHLGYHSTEAILSEIAWIENLYSHHIVTTAKILKGCNGKKLQKYHDDMTHNDYHMILFEFLSGEHVNETDDLPQKFYHLGKVTAKLHQHVKQWCYSPDYPDYFTRLSWDFDGTIGKNPHWGAWQNAPYMNEDAEILLTQAQQKIADNLQIYGKNADNFGLIHADLRIANFLMEGDDIKIIDFDDSGFGWFMYDLGAAFSFIENHPEKPAMIKKWLEGYQQIHSLTTRDIALIPTFIMLRKMVLLGWIGSHSATELAIQQSKNFTLESSLLAEEFLTLPSF